MNRRAYVIAKCDMHSVREFAEVAFAHVGQNQEDYVKTDTPHSRSVEVDILLANPARAKEELDWSARIVLLGLIFVALCPCTPLQAQDFWKVMPLPLDRSVWAIAANRQGDIFVSMLQRGVYKTTDRGKTWVKSNLEHEWVYSLAKSGLGVLYAGAEARGGMYRSTDDGETWEQIGNQQWITVSITIDKREYIYAGIYREGLVRSKDKGTTWEQILADSGNASSVVVDSDNTIYFSPGRKLYRSTDDGMNWEQFNELPERKFILSNGLTVNSKGNLIVLAGTSFEGGTVVAISTDKALTWSESRITTTDVGTGILNTSADQIFVATNGSGVFRSLNKGVTWDTLRGGMRNVTSGPPLAELPDGHVVYGSRGEIGISLFPTKSSVVPSPYGFLLNQNVPNPAVGSATIAFSLPTTGFASLTIHDLLGRTVATLLESIRLQGPNEVTFDTRDLRTGTYFYRLQSGTQAQTRPMVVIK